MGFYMAIYNDTIVMTLSYFPLLFTDFVPDVETRYSAGWVYITLVALMVIGNLAVVLRSSILDIAQEAKRTAVELHNYHVVKPRGLADGVAPLTPLQKIRKYLGLDWLYGEDD